jgi:hypothetical protein
MIGDGLGMLECPAVFEIRDDAGGTEGVAAGRVGQGGGLGPALDHEVTDVGGEKWIERRGVRSLRAPVVAGSVSMPSRTSDGGLVGGF